MSAVRALVSATTFDDARPRVVPGSLRATLAIIGDLLGVTAVVLCVPFAILAVGIPIALCLRLVLWLLAWLPGMA